MLNPRDRAILVKIQNELDDINEYVTGIDFETFNNAGVIKKAVSMSIINMAELAKHLSPEFVDAHQYIPFKALKATRHVAAHEYQQLRFDYIWEAIQTDFPQLKSDIQKIISQ